MPRILPSSDDIFERAYLFTQEHMRQYDASHDFSHIERVLRLAERIAESERSGYGQRLNMNIVRLAALLHDIGDRKYVADDPPDPVYRFLISADAKDSLAKTVQLITDCVSFTKEKKDPALVQSTLSQHPELGVVQDADRLDALGAIGIGRCFAFGAANAERHKGVAAQTPHAVSESFEQAWCMADAVAHIDEKLVKLQGMMKTETGRHLARRRTERLTTFQSWWEEEQGML